MQCRQMIPALNAWAARDNVDDRTRNCHQMSCTRMRSQAPDPKTERGFDLQATWVIDVFAYFLACYLLVIVQPDVRSTGAGF